MVISEKDLRNQILFLMVEKVQLINVNRKWKKFS